MPENDPLDSFDWNLTTWEGSRREQLRRWAELTLEEIVQAQEEMAQLNLSLAQVRGNVESKSSTSGTLGAMDESSAQCGPKTARGGETP